MKLTKINSFLLQELVYYKDTRVAKIKFLEKAIKLYLDIEGTLVDFNYTLKERLKA